MRNEILTEKITQAGEIPAWGWVPPVDNYTQQHMEEKTLDKAARTNGYQTPEFDRLMAEAETQTDAQKRQEAMKSALTQPLRFRRFAGLELPTRECRQHPPQNIYLTHRHPCPSK